MPAGYAPLPTQQPSPEADRELDEAFASDNEEERYSVPAPPKSGYDFERDFDYVRPPPGSPPRPSAVALPNDIGNSNGLVPSSVAPPDRRPSLFRRALGAFRLLPTTTESRTLGGGTQNDGVFANVTAKPSRPVQVRTDDGNVYVMPEETQTNAPPSYTAAQADAVPPYWETTVHAPAGLDTDSGMIIDDLPSGSIFIFLANFFTSFFFQFVGFLLTYLLHTTHAAKLGSRAGLGLTLIKYGFYSRPGDDGFDMPSLVDDLPEQTPERSFLPTPTPTGRPSAESPIVNISSNEWLSFLLMTLGWFILLSSLIGFWRIKHWEASIRATQARGSPERDISTRRMIQGVLRLGESDSARGETHVATQQQLEEVQLERDLRSAGLL